MSKHKSEDYKISAVEYYLDYDTVSEEVFVVVFFSQIHERFGRQLFFLFPHAGRRKGRQKERERGYVRYLDGWLVWQ